MSDLKSVRRALLSVTDKTGLVEFAKTLSELGVELVSTGGTAKALRGAGLPVRDVAELTGFPEMLGGRVKTLHPVVHGGILHRRGDPEHVAAVEEHGIGPIDMVVVNLYAFEKTAAKPGVKFEEIIENIDIGGPSMLRSAAKNFEDVAVVTSAADYPALAEELRASGGRLSGVTRWRLARAAFATTAAYDAAIASTLEGLPDVVEDRSGLQPSGSQTNAEPGAMPQAGIERAVGASPADGDSSGGPEAAGASSVDAGADGDSSVGANGRAETRPLQANTQVQDTQVQDEIQAGFPETLRVFAKRKMTLRYGENPHQKAAVYVDGSGKGIAGAEQLGGKELSFNNLVDLDACWALTSEFEDCAVAIIKHTNPCGVAQGATLREAYLRALAADPVSAFGGVIGINRTVDADAAGEIAKLFVEAIVAPEFTSEALAVLAARKNLRLLRIQPHKAERVLKQISGGYLLQDEDHAVTDASTVRLVTKRPPTDEEMKALLFAWKVSKHVKSNAILYARLDDGFGQSVGVGAGQMSRVDAARFGAMKAVLPLKGTVAASDAFFPFPDGVEAIVQAGATAIIQPGGSVKDPEVIAAADKLGVAMVMTGIRHFRHG